MNRLRKIYEEFETDEEVLLWEEIMNEGKMDADVFFKQDHFKEILSEHENFRKKFKVLEAEVFPKMFDSATKALGSIGKVLQGLELLNLKEAKGKMFFNACIIFIRQQRLLITISGNVDTYKLDVGVCLNKNQSCNKEYNIDAFSEDDLEHQIIEVLKA